MDVVEAFTVCEEELDAAASAYAEPSGAEPVRDPQGPSAATASRSNEAGRVSCAGADNNPVEYEPPITDGHGS
jgi:hypothetical protein